MLDVARVGRNASLGVAAGYLLAGVSLLAQPARSTALLLPVVTLGVGVGGAVPARSWLARLRAVLAASG